MSLCFVHVGQDLEEQEELLECLLAFFTQYLLADDDITCLKSGTALHVSCAVLCRLSAHADRVLMTPEHSARFLVSCLFSFFKARAGCVLFSFAPRHKGKSV